jgi:thiol:disulfide interchange protein
MRGGQVFERVLEEVEAILLKAGSEQKLVVIDFGATWCVASRSDL